MPDTYSVDEATTQLTAIIARVRLGETVAIVDGGVPVAEIRPATSQAGDPADTDAAADADPLAARLAELEARGALQRAPVGPRPPLVPGEPRPGALERFLAERD